MCRFLLRGIVAAGLLAYSTATSLSDFWTAALVAFILYVSTGVGSALVINLVERRSVGRGLAFFDATGWMGAILAFAGGGYVFAAAGYADGFLLGAGLVAVAIVLLVPIAVAMRTRQAPMPRRGIESTATRKD